jgi:hypothetical protein
MAQKVFPRSLRSQKILSTDLVFYDENNYASVWAKTYQMASNVLAFSQKNLVSKKKRKIGAQKRPSYKQKTPTFLNTRWILANWMGTYQMSPVLFKFEHQSMSQKYNPIKAVYRVRRSIQKPIGLLAQNSLNFWNPRKFNVKSTGKFQKNSIKKSVLLYIASLFVTIRESMILIYPVK